MHRSRDARDVVADQAGSGDGGPVERHDPDGLPHLERHHRRGEAARRGVLVGEHRRRELLGRGRGPQRRPDRPAARCRTGCPHLRFAEHQRPADAGTYQAVDDGLVAAVTLLNAIRAALAEEGVIRAAV